MNYDPKGSRVNKTRVVWWLVRRNARSGHVGAFRQLLEMTVLWFRNGIKPWYYLSGGLGRRELSWNEKAAFISEPRYRRLCAKVNPPRYHFVTDNKLAAHGLLALFAIPSPPFYGRIHETNGQTFDGRPLCTATDLENLLRRLGVDEVVFKVITGLRGKGFIKATLDLDANPPTVFVQPDGPRLTFTELWEQRLTSRAFMGYFCQGVIDQHEGIAKFNASSVNTIRTWMYQPEDGVWEMYAAVLRIGAGNRVIDNIKQGGLGPRVDVETGTIRPAILGRPERPIVDTHPFSGLKFAGETVPMWNEILALCKRAAGLFPYLRLVATDVALSREGPLITEVTAVPDDHQIGFDRGVGPFLQALLGGFDGRARRVVAEAVQRERQRTQS